ncbi:MAG: hypothetical protein GX585_00725 [Clostridiales bacterium]|nr:hypothetical protein [Clostridiales bacterium]
MGLLSALLVLSYVNLTVLHSDTVSLRNELAALQGEESVLMAKYELAYDLKTIGETVTASGQMVKPVEGQIYVLDLSEPDSVVYYEKESALEGVAGMLRGGREIFDAMLEYFR